MEIERVHIKGTQEEKFEKENPILIETRDNLLKNIKDVYDNLEKSKNISKFLDKVNKNAEISDTQYKYAKKLGKAGRFILFKGLAILLFTSHLVSVYVIDGLINAIEEELIAAAKSYIQKKDRKSDDDFYQNFIKLNNKFPDYSIFYISSFLSDYLNSCLGYILLTIIILIINFVSLFFGFRKFLFNIERNNYTNYHLFEFIYLYVLYLCFCLCQGIIALLPLQIIKKGYIFYDIFSEKMESEKNNNNQNGKNIENIENNINIKNITNDLKENNLSSVNITAENQNRKENNPNLSNQKQEIGLKKLDGYFLFFLISITASIFVKTFFDQVYVRNYDYKSSNKVNNYFIIIYTISTSISFIFYLLYKFFLTRGEEKEKITTNTTEIFGYIIYNKTKKSNDIFCHLCNNEYECESCQDCKICCETLNRSLCLNLSSCKACWKNIFCCCFCYCSWKCRQYKCCKYCECDKLEKTEYKKIKMGDINKIENLTIIYRTTGKWNWLGALMTNPIVYIIIIFLYLILISNIGFEEKLWNNFENNQGGTKNSYCINGIVLGTIIFFYVISRLIGKLILKQNFIEEVYEYLEVSIGHIPFFLIQALYSLIISGIIYFKEIKGENILLSISIGIVEYMKIFILEYITFMIETNIKYLNFFSLSTIFSFYLLVWDIILFILEVCDAKYSSMILFHFIFLVVLFGILLVNYILLPIVIFCYDSIKKI